MLQTHRAPNNGKPSKKPTINNADAAAFDKWALKGLHFLLNALHLFYSIAQFQAIHCFILIKSIESYIEQRQIGFCDSFSTHLPNPKPTIIANKKLHSKPLLLMIETKLPSISIFFSQF